MDRNIVDARQISEAARSTVGRDRRCRSGCGGGPSGRTCDRCGRCGRDRGSRRGSGCRFGKTLGGDSGRGRGRVRGGSFARKLCTRLPREKRPADPTTRRQSDEIQAPQILSATRPSVRVRSVAIDPRIERPVGCALLNRDVRDARQVAEAACPRLGSRGRGRGRARAGHDLPICGACGFNDRRRSSTRRLGDRRREGNTRAICVFHKNALSDLRSGVVEALEQLTTCVPFARETRIGTVRSLRPHSRTRRVRGQ